jgi:membrane-associated protease RseP (regulator of RpoE activity)
MNGFGALLILTALVLVHGCATPAPPKPQTLYQSWDRTLDRGNLKTVDDVSMILGSPPIKCDEIEPTRTGTLTGIFLGSQSDPDAPIINYVRPNSPAALANMAVGEYIQYVNDKKVETAADVLDDLALVPIDAPVSIKTKKNAYTLLFPQPTLARQCYWEISGGPVGHPGGSALVLSQSAAPGGAATLHQRFFKTVCRFYDGTLVGCISNWQE